MKRPILLAGVTVMFLLILAAQAITFNYTRNKLKRIETAQADIREDIKASREQSKLALQSLARRVSRASPVPAAGQLREREVAPGLERVAFLNAVDIYQKNGLVEVYGADFDQRRNGPVSVAASLLRMHAAQSWLLWSPDRAPAIAPRFLVVRIAPDQLDKGTLSVGIRTASGALFVWEHSLADDGEAAEPLPDPELPEWLAGELEIAQRGVLSRLDETVFRAEIPGDLRDELTAEEGSLRTWMLGLSGAAPGTFAIEEVALSSDWPVKAHRGMGELSGLLAGSSWLPDTTVELWLESGEKRRLQVSTEGRFRFDSIPLESAVSVRVRVNGTEHFATLGRWFQVDSFPMSVSVDLRPYFQNPQGNPPPENSTDIRSEFPPPGDMPPTFVRYAPHRRITWLGAANKPQEFIGETFSNNHGFPDRDRFFDNRDNCVRIAYVGGSTAVAIQVRPFEKYNALMEERIGLALGRCVEVISAGRDNGDIAANYRLIRDYIAKLRPAMIVIENMRPLNLQLNPLLLERTLGWSSEHNVLDSFYRDDTGSLRFREWDPAWGIFAVKPTQEPVFPGVSAWKSLDIPRPHLPAPAIEALEMFHALIVQYGREFSPARLAVATGVDQANCAWMKNCDEELTLEDGTTIANNPLVFVDHMEQLCRRAEVPCLQPDPPWDHDTPESKITFVNDGHYSVPGHQWLARELSARVVDALSE